MFITKRVGGFISTFYIQHYCLILLLIFKAIFFILDWFSVEFSGINNNIRLPSTGVSNNNCNMF